MSDTLKRTPKTLNEAIYDAFDKMNDQCRCGNCQCCHADQYGQMVKDHVLDYLAQHFTAAAMGNMTLVDLWARIIRK